MVIKLGKSMSRQEHKYQISLSGEFLVAGELLRRGIKAAVTYGNAKKADVVAVSDSKAIDTEVKTTSNPIWVVGGKLPAPGKAIWIFVHLPLDQTQSPQYFVLSGSELRAILEPIDSAYKERFRTRHGRESEGRGVVSLKKPMIPTEYKGAWHKIEHALKGKAPARRR